METSSKQKEGMFMSDLENIISKSKKKKTRVPLDNKKLNLMEMKKKLNEKRIKSNASKHCKMLYKIGETRQQIIRYFKKMKELNTIEEVYPFAPKFNKNSRKIMEKRKSDVVLRNEKFLENKKEKINTLKEYLKNKDEAHFIQMMTPEKKNEYDYKVESKVKLFLEGKLVKMEKLEKAKRLRSEEKKKKRKKI